MSTLEVGNYKSNSEDDLDEEEEEVCRLFYNSFCICENTTFLCILFPKLLLFIDAIRK